MAQIAEVLQEFNYDHDGNLTSDGLVDYQWDAENRLIRMETSSNAQTYNFPHRVIEFRYDYMGRRVQKRVIDADADPAVDISYRRFLYDGWNLVAEFNLEPGTSDLSLVRSYTWGLDIVNTMASAGGVGALLQIADHATGRTFLPSYDGNGNVAALFNADTGEVAAAYEYSPYGEPLRAQSFDPAVADNPFRFSTKFTDVETGLVYYGHRYYEPRNGRFINRDPIEEAGGLNLYGFVGNNPVNRWDYLGMEPSRDPVSANDTYVDFELRDGITYKLTYNAVDPGENDYEWNLDSEDEIFSPMAGSILESGAGTSTPSSPQQEVAPMLFGAQVDFGEWWALNGPFVTDSAGQTAFNDTDLFNWPGEAPTSALGGSFFGAGTPAAAGPLPEMAADDIGALTVTSAASIQAIGGTPTIATATANQAAGSSSSASVVSTPTTVAPNSAATPTVNSGPSWSQFGKGAASFGIGVITAVTLAGAEVLTGGLATPAVIVGAGSAGTLMTHGIGNMVAAFSPDRELAARMLNWPATVPQYIARALGGQSAQDVVGIAESVNGLRGFNQAGTLDRTKSALELAESVQSAADNARQPAPQPPPTRTSTQRTNPRY